jgi:serine O-acetyltransferase
VLESAGTARPLRITRGPRAFGGRSRYIRLGMRVLREIVADTTAIATRFIGPRLNAREVVATMSHDGSLVLVMVRLREAATRHRIPIFGSFVRRLQTLLFGIEIAREVRLGEGVVFLHTVGVVIGGNSQIGDRVMFLGGNTIGSIDRKGYPRIGNDVVIGAGARILGPVTIGDGASIGANAVVLCDVPPGAIAVGVPAVVRPRAGQAASPALSDPG